MVKMVRHFSEGLGHPVNACSRGPIPTLRDFAGNMTEQTFLLESRQTSSEDPTFGSPVDLSCGRHVLGTILPSESPCLTAPGEGALVSYRPSPQLCCIVVPPTTG